MPLVLGQGNPNAKIALVGEAPGQQEELTGMPFIGDSGQELTRMLTEAGIDRKQVFLTNVLSERPPDNKLDAFCGKRADVGGNYSLPPLGSGNYLRPEFLHNLDRLKQELQDIKPNVVVALGGTASWALLSAPKISTVRGTVASSSLVPGLKVLPTFHPSAVLRNWEYRPIVLTDLIKAERQSHFPELRRPEREIYYDPEYGDLEFFRKGILESGAFTIGADIETMRRTVTCISFAPSPQKSFVIPFWDSRKPHGNYWETAREEREWWDLVEEVMSCDIEKVFQNGLYDLQYLVSMGIRCRRVNQDTMILHHSMYPEMQKSLGFLGSVYTEEASWKLLRPRGEDSNKREDE